MKKKVQIQMSIDEELAQKIHEDEVARFEAEQEAKFTEEQETTEDEPTHSVSDIDWDDVQAQIQVDEDLAQRMLEEERESQDIEERARLLAEFNDKRKKIQAQQKYEAIKSKPPTRAQRRKYMTTYLKHQANWKAHQFKGYSFKEIKDIFNKAYKQVQSFVPMETRAEGSKVEVGSSKRLAEEELQQESTKKQKTSKDELSKEDIQQMMMIVLVEGINVEALQTKDDLVKLWSLVKERFSSAEPTEDMERSLWVELKRLFKPDDDDTLWKVQRYMHDPLAWRLYDTCGVHHVSSARGHDIYMLVEKDYPLSHTILTLMLIAKLMVDVESEMPNELLRKIFMLANKPIR
ncbi:hypothetical protein Tco_1189646 [Tanacetum coccineum]